jgi:hypothetical protein
VATLNGKEHDKDVAKRGCDAWAAKCVASADRELGECRTNVKFGIGTEEECRKRYLRNMRRCARIHQKNLATIDKAYEDRVVVAGEPRESLPPVA